MYFEALASGGGSDWYYTILMKAPLGAKITVDDGDEEVEATGAGMDTIIGIPVHDDSSTYTVSVEMNGLTAPTSSITTPATSGGISSIVEVPFAKISLTYDDEFRGQSMSMTDGTHTASPSPVLPVLGNTVDVYVPYTGNWTLEATDPVSGNQFNSSPNPVPVVSLDQTINAGLYVIPDGKTVLPVNDIETWLLCADIKDVSYTTLAEVLADEDVLRRLLTDDNAIDYLKRSTGWSVNPGLVPIMIDATHPEGEAGCYPSAFVGSEDYSGWRAFTRDNTLSGAIPNQFGGVIWYKFNSDCNIKAFDIYHLDRNSRAIRNNVQLVGSNDGTNWTNIGSEFTMSGTNVTDYFTVDNNSEYLYWGIKIVGSSSGHEISNGYGYHIQFYSRTDKGITGNETAMSYISAYDYAADTLLSDSDWFDALYTSEYSEKVITTVPTMTDDTHPSGECFYGWANVGTESPSDYRNPYLAFDGDDATRCFTKYANPSYDQWIGYDFKKPIRVVAARLINCNWSGTYRAKNVFIKASNDRNTYTAISSDYTMPESSDPQIIKFNNNLTAYNNWAVHIKDAYVGTDSGTGINEIQFYGRQAAGVQTLLKAAGVDRPYTTLEELFADKEALATVIGSHAAIDYLVTVKDWIDEFTSDETAMLFIGGDNYAADTLLGDSDWSDAIYKSEYAELVLTMVPKMTSNTTPSGVASSSAIGQYTYMLFDRDETGYARYQSNSPNVSYAQYEFPDPVVITKAYFTSEPFNFSISGSNDGITFTSLLEVTSRTSDNMYDIPNSTAYKYYRITQIAAYSAAANLGWVEIQFYGREDVTEGVHIFSAASDTIYDQNNNVIATTDTSGYAFVSKSLLPNGTYTLRSTKAKDPDNLSNDFTKVVNVTDATKAIVLMPDKVIYWFGYKDTRYNDWSIQGVAGAYLSNTGATNGYAPTVAMNTYNINIAMSPAASGDGYIHAGYARFQNIDISDFDTFKVITGPVVYTTESYNIKQAFCLSTTNYVRFDATSDDRLYSISRTNETEITITAYAYGTINPGNITIRAIYGE